MAEVRAVGMRRVRRARVRGCMVGIGV